MISHIHAPFLLGESLLRSGAPGGHLGVQGGQNEVPCFQLACYYWPESDEHTPFLRVSVGQAQTVLTMPPMNGGNNLPGPLWGQRVYAASCALVVLEAKQVGSTR